MSTAKSEPTPLKQPLNGLQVLRYNEQIRRRKAYNRATEMEKFLRGQRWDWFVTITSRHHMTLASSRRVAEIFLKLVKLSSSEYFCQGSENHLVDISKGNDGLAMWVAEPHKHAESGYHLHLLVRLPFRFRDLTNKQQFKLLLQKARMSVGGEEWENKRGILGLWHRIKLEPYKGHKASEYCAKYLTKNLCDYDFSPIL